MSKKRGRTNAARNTHATRAPAVIPAAAAPALVGNIITSDGYKHINNDGYMELMGAITGELAAGGSLSVGSAGMNTPTARRMKSRAVAGQMRMNNLLLENSSGIAFRIVTEPVDAAVNPGFTVVSDNPDDVKRVEDFFDEHDIWDAIATATAFKRSDGWAVLVKGDGFVRPHPGHVIEPSHDWYGDYNSPLFGLPAYWRVTLKSPVGGTVDIPQDRSILFGDVHRQNINEGNTGWIFGQSILSRVYAALERLGLTAEFILSILSQSVQDVLTRNDLDQELETKDGEAKAARRVGGIAATKNINDLIIIDNKEKMERLQSTFTGLNNLPEFAIRVICAESGVPLSVIANTSSGLSNNDDSGDEVWRRLVETIQTKDVIPAARKIALEYLGIRCKFVPNKSQGDIRRDAEVDELRAKTLKQIYDMRAITSEEVRETVREYGIAKLLSERMPPELKEDPTGDDDDQPDNAGNDNGKKDEE
ncbi:DUF1073 domain-containing protein [Salmonella enterica]|nr:DUF1073 domain-containing protein [Salmonella enterica]